MNNTRRKTIAGIKEGITKAQEELTAVHKWFSAEASAGADATVISEWSAKARTLRGKIEDLQSELENPKDEEQEAYENLPEGLQQGERGDVMQENVNYLESAISLLQEAMDELDNIQ